MRRHNRIRVPYFQALLDQMRRQAAQLQSGREIVRRPGNPMLRYVAACGSGDEAVSIPITSPQENLDLRVSPLPKT